MRQSTKQSIFFLAPILLFLFPAQGAAQTSEQAVSLSEKSVQLAVDSSQTAYQLPDSLLIPGSEVVRLDSLLLQAPRDYELNYVHGTLTLSRDGSTGTTLNINYRYFPISLRTKYSHREIVRAQALGDSSESGAGTDASAGQVTAPVRQEFVPSNLRKSGSIVRGVSVGSNQGLQVDSGLRLQVAGNLTRNIEVVASLTDQNTPIQPEGNTQTLQEIDKVFVQLKGPNAQATLGDFNLNFIGSELMNYNRKLEGAMLQGDFPASNFKVSAAVSRGQFTTNEFMGQEGNQGPYQLRGENGNINILVLAGTERVWVDGEPMVRGENRDYTIEYGNGQITFTRNRLITADSRITVDFQFSDESFQRNYLAAQGETRLLNDKVLLGTTFIRESDDKDDPLTIPLSDESLAILSTAGDGRASVPGDTLVGAGNGNYVKDADGVFIYVGPGNGDYNVRFSFFGRGQGDYRNIGLGRYEFVGPGNGDYLPLIILPVAQRHDLVGLRLETAPVSYMNVSSELAFSQVDRNLYSGLDDSDNGGAAFALNFDLRPDSLRVGDRNFGQFDLNAHLRRKGANFRDIDRTTIAEFGRRWNISNPLLSNEENIVEMQSRYLPVPGFQLRGGLGRLEKSTAFSSDRWEVQTALQRPGLPRVQYFIEHIASSDRILSNESNWLRQRGSSDVNIWCLKPGIAYEGEIRKDSRQDSLSSGFRYNSYTGSLAFEPWKSLAATASYNVRDDDDRRDSTFVNKSIAKTQSYALTLRNWHAFDVTASFTHRNRDFRTGAGQNTRTDLADLKIGFRPQQGSVRGNIYYQISNTQVAQQEEVFIEVEEGQGNYRFNEDLGEFEPDPFGDFVRRIFATNNFIPVVELRAQADFRLNPASFWSKNRGKEQEPAGWVQRILTPLSFESFVRIDERTTESDVQRVYLLDPAVLRQDSTTIFGSFEWRQDVHLWENQRNFSLRYRYRDRDELNNQFVESGQDRRVLEHLLRVRAQISRIVTTQMDFGLTAEDRLFDSPAREDRRVRSRRAEIDLAYRPQSKWELALKTDFSLNKDIVPNPETRATQVSFAPRGSYAISSKGRARAEIEWRRVSLSPRTRLIPYELTQGNRAGTTFRWSFGFDYRVSQNVQMSLSYLGRNEPDRPKTQHIAKVEMRAFF